jgi:hypothetical protein
MIQRCAMGMSFALLLACGADADERALHEYVQAHFGAAGMDSVGAIFVLTEEGCPVCDRRFADLVRPRLGCARCLFIVRAQGGAFSLKGFLDERENIRFDDGTFKKLGLLEGSGLLRLREGRIERIMPIHVEGIDAQLSYASNVLDSLDRQVSR